MKRAMKIETQQRGREATNYFSVVRRCSCLALFLFDESSPEDILRAWNAAVYYREELRKNLVGVLSDQNPLVARIVVYKRVSELGPWNEAPCAVPSEADLAVWRQAS